MLRLIAALALTLAAAPAFAQAAPEPAPAAPTEIDARLVGVWTLMEVTDAGEMGRYGAQIDKMTCTFGADGEAEVAVSILQDQDRHQKEKSFQFETEGGQILADDAPPMSYQVIGGDLLELRDGTGLVLRLHRTGTNG